MRTFKVSDELYEQLKSFVVDPFDDTPEAVIGRLIEIVNKAKSRWSPFEEEKKAASQPEADFEPTTKQQPASEPVQQEEEEEVVLL